MRLLWLALLPFTAQAATTVTVESYSATFGELVLTISGDVVDVRLDAQGAKVFDWIAIGGEGGTAIPTVPGIGTNNDGSNSAFLTVRGPFTATVDLDPVSNQSYPGLTATINGASQPLLVGIGAVFSTDPIPPPPPPTITGTAPLSWLPPTTNTDGTPLTNLSGFKVYWGTTQGTYPNSQTLGVVTSYTVENLSPGTWYFVVTAIAGGTESAFSNVASKTICCEPPPPPTDPCVTNPLTFSVQVWPSAPTGRRRFEHTKNRAADVTIARDLQSATAVDDRGCTKTVPR